MTMGLENTPILDKTTAVYSSKLQREDRGIETEVLGPLREWHVIGAVLAILTSAVVLICCCCDFRVPRTRQQVEENYIKRKMNRKYYCCLHRKPDQMKKKQPSWPRRNVPGKSEVSVTHSSGKIRCGPPLRKRNQLSTFKTGFYDADKSKGPVIQQSAGEFGGFSLTHKTPPTPDLVQIQDSLLAGVQTQHSPFIDPQRSRSPPFGAHTSRLAQSGVQIPHAHLDVKTPGSDFVGVQIPTSSPDGVHTPRSPLFGVQTLGGSALADVHTPRPHLIGGQEQGSDFLGSKIPRLPLFGIQTPFSPFAGFKTQCPPLIRIQVSFPPPTGIHKLRPTPVGVLKLRPLRAGVQKRNPPPAGVQKLHPTFTGVQKLHPLRAGVQKLNPSPVDVQKLQPPPVGIQTPLAFRPRDILAIMSQKASFGAHEQRNDPLCTNLITKSKG